MNEIPIGLHLSHRRATVPMLLADTPIPSTPLVFPTLLSHVASLLPFEITYDMYYYNFKLRNSPQDFINLMNFLYKCSFIGCHSLI